MRPVSNTLPADSLIRSRYGNDTAIKKSTVRSGGVIPVSNILARYNSGTGRRILLVAHYDTRPWADNDPNAANHSTPVPGANDGASGVGVLPELARLMSERNTAAGVDLLFVDAEDSGNDGDENSWCLGTGVAARQAIQRHGAAGLCNIA